MKPINLFLALMLIAFLVLCGPVAWLIILIVSPFLIAILAAFAILGWSIRTLFEVAAELENWTFERIETWEKRHGR